MTKYFNKKKTLNSWFGTKKKQISLKKRKILIHPIIKCCDHKGVKPFLDYHSVIFFLFRQSLLMSISRCARQNDLHTGTVHDTNAENMQEWLSLN